MDIAVSEVSEQTLTTYARLFQLEHWLRQMVYVELKAKYADEWSSHIQGWTRPFDADKRLTHMPTQEESPLSYITLSQLRKVVEENWVLFQGYLPPKNIWEARLDEVGQVRNRIAHFRKGHSEDLSRVLQLLKDVDQGLWRFCTSYNEIRHVLPQSSDPVTKEFVSLDPFAPKEVEENVWAPVGVVPEGTRFIVSVQTLRRNWAPEADVIAGTEGYFYDVSIHVREQREYDYQRLLKSSLRLHNSLVYVHLDSHWKRLRVTIPAVLGDKKGKYSIYPLP